MAYPSTAQPRQDLDQKTDLPASAATSQRSDETHPSQASRLAGGATTATPSERAGGQETQAVEELRQTGREFLSEQKAKAANQISCLSDAIRSAARQMREDGNVSTAGYAELAASRLEGAARFLGDQDLRSLMSEAERAVRRRPELFLGGMFLVGLGISRFLKASRGDEST
ncbi:MAG: hypothetical protein DCC67_03715 [Planctomycetota bacterium]|nr:MAG: hypothetical protein DCC67_03715 [Planctomycetota bacterium]